MKRTSWCLVCLCSVTICAGQDKENLGHILDRLIANLEFPSTGRATYRIEECDAWSQAARVLRCKYVFTGSLYGFEVVTVRPGSSLGDLNVRRYFNGQETICWIHREKVATIWEGRRGQTPIYRLQRFCPTEILEELLGNELELKGSCDINGIPCSLLECVVSSKDRTKVWVAKEPDVYPLRIERYEYDNLLYVYESENVKYWRKVLFPEKISIGWYRPAETWEHSLISSYVVTIESFVPNIEVAPAEFKPELPSETAVNKRPLSQAPAAAFKPTLPVRRLRRLDDLQIEFNIDQAKGRMILLCFFDPGQRPSRHLVAELAKRAEELRDKGLTLVGVQASKVDKKELNDWVKKYNIPFPVGMVKDDLEGIKAKWRVHSLPWLILTDKEHIVTAEGLGVAELADKLKDGAESREAVEESESEAPRSQDSSGWKNDFERVYRLSQGEVLKRIAPPFIAERREYLAEEMPRYYTPGRVAPLNAIIFQWDGHLTRSGWSCSAGYSLGAVLQAVIGLEYYEFELAGKLQYLLLTGDWIVRKDSTIEDRLKAFELILKSEIGKEIRFVKGRASRPLILATGSFRFHPLSGTYDDSRLHFFAEALDLARPDYQREHHALRSANSVPSEVGRLVGVQVRNQTDPSDETMVGCSFHRSAYLAGVKDEGQKNRKLNLLLANITSQTGLKFTMKRQSAELWSVNELKGSEDNSVN